MIEVSLKQIDAFTDCLFATKLMMWLLEEFHKCTDEALKGINFQGYIVVCDKETAATSILIFCDRYSILEKKLTQILMQPPGEYKDRYIACVYRSEPDPVTEQQQDSSEELSIEIDEPS